MTCALIGAFEFGAKVYYGDPRFDTYITMTLNLFPTNYTLGEALKVLRYGMPLFLQAALLMMDNSFDVVREVADDPTAILTKICDRQQDLIKQAKNILEVKESFGPRDDEGQC